MSRWCQILYYFIIKYHLPRIDEYSAVVMNLLLSWESEWDNGQITNHELKIDLGNNRLSETQLVNSVFLSHRVHNGRLNLIPLASLAQWTQPHHESTSMTYCQVATVLLGSTLNSTLSFNQFSLFNPLAYSTANRRLHTVGLSNRVNLLNHCLNHIACNRPIVNNFKPCLSKLLLLKSTSTSFANTPSSHGYKSAQCSLKVSWQQEIHYLGGV